MKSSRNSYLDVVKGLGILLVVAGHAIQYGMGSGYDGFWNLPMFKFIYSFHMPLFMAVSGWLFWFSYSKRGGKSVLKDRAKTLLYPIFVYGIICNIPVLIRNPEDFSVHNAFFKANLWFFWSVLFATCLACLMFKLNKLFHIKEWVSVFVLFFGMMLFDDNWLIAQHKFVVPYFLLGGVICKYKLAYCGQKCWIAIPLYCLSMLFYKSDTYIYVSMYSITQGDAMPHLWTDIYRFVVGALGTVSFMLLVKYMWMFIEKWQLLHDALIWLGKNTLFIYFIQGLVFAVLARVTMPYMGVWQPCATFIFVMAASACFVMMVRRSLFVGRLFFGKDYRDR